MTVSTTTSAIAYTASGSTAIFPYTWQIVQDADLIVYQTSVDGLTLTLLALTTDYTVTGAGISTGGNVVLVAGNPTAGTKVFIASDPEQIQQLLLQQGAGYNPADVMAALDLLTREVQATRRIADLGLQFPVSEALAGLASVAPTAAARANKYAAFDADGNLVVSSGTGGAIADGAVTTAKLAAGAVTTAKIADGAVTTAKFDAAAKAPLAGAADTATLAATATAVAANGANTAAIQNEAVTNAKMAPMAAFTYKGNDTAAPADPIDLTRERLLRSLCLCVPHSIANILSSTHPTANDAPYVSRTGSMYSIAQGNVAFKTHSRKGLVSALAPSTLTGGSRGGAIYLGDAVHKVLFFGGAGGFITMDVDTDVFDTLVTPTDWGQISAAYHAASGYVYYAASDKPRRCLIDGTSNSAGNSVTGTPSRVCIVGDLLFVLDDTGSGASKVWKYDTASWGNRGSAITLGGDTALYSGLAHHSGLGYLIVGDYNGTLLIVDPATLTTVATVTLSGVSARITQHIIYDATVNRIYALDTTGKIWVVDGASPFSVLGYIVPYSESPAIGALAGLTYDGDLGLLTTRINSSVTTYRHRA